MLATSSDSAAGVASVGTSMVCRGMYFYFLRVCVFEFLSVWLMRQQVNPLHKHVSLSTAPPALANSTARIHRVAMSVLRMYASVSKLAYCHPLVNISWDLVVLVEQGCCSYRSAFMGAGIWAAFLHIALLDIWPGTSWYGLGRFSHLQLEQTGPFSDSCL